MRRNTGRECGADYGIDIDELGVPRGEGESWDEAAERLDVEKALEESRL